MNEAHVFKGELKAIYKPKIRDGVRETVRATGSHHVSPQSTTQRIVPGTQSPPNVYGVVRGKVEILDPSRNVWVQKKAMTTFFPESWTEAEVECAIHEAFANSIFTSPREWTGVLPNGMKIQGYYDKDKNVIDTAYPLYDSTIPTAKKRN